MTTDRTLKVLMIEDNLDQAHLMNALLERHERHFDVDVVHDPISGLESIAQRSYDAIILDYNLILTPRYKERAKDYKYSIKV